MKMLTLTAIAATGLLAACSGETETPKAPPMDGPATANAAAPHADDDTADPTPANGADQGHPHDGNEAEHSH